MKYELSCPILSTFGIYSLPEDYTYDNRMIYGGVYSICQMSSLRVHWMRSDFGRVL